LFKHGDSYYYKISALAINDNSKEWLSWVIQSIGITENEFKTLKGAGE